MAHREVESRGRTIAVLAKAFARVKARLLPASGEVIRATCWQTLASLGNTQQQDSRHVRTIEAPFARYEGGGWPFGRVGGPADGGGVRLVRCCANCRHSGRINVRSAAQLHIRLDAHKTKALFRTILRLANQRKSLNDNFAASLCWIRIVPNQLEVVRSSERSIVRDAGDRTARFASIRKSVVVVPFTDSRFVK